MVSPRTLLCEDTTGGGVAAVSPGTTGVRSAGAEESGRQLRLAVSMRAGPPARVLIRSPQLSAPEFSSEIRVTLVAGFKV